MTDNSESTVQGGEQGQSPVVPASQQASVSQGSDGQSVDDLVSLIVNHPTFQRSMQSLKDKRFAKLDQVESTVEQHDENLARLAKYLGVEPDKVAQAQRQVEIDDNMKWIAEQRRVMGQTAQGSAVDLSKTHDTLLKSVGLDQPPQGYGDYLATLDWSDPVNATILAQKWLQGYVNGAPKPKPSDTAPPSGGSGDTLNPYPNLSDDELGVLFEQLMKHPSKQGNEAKMDKIIAELERRDTK